VKVVFALKYLALVSHNTVVSSSQTVQVEIATCTDILVEDPSMLSVLDDVRDIRYDTNDE
jgi:hypothetical protein